MHFFWQKCEILFSLLSEVDFTTSVTTSTWPSNQYWFIVAKDLGSTLEEEDIMKPSSQKVNSQIQEDYTKVDVYFQTLVST